MSLCQIYPCFSAKYNPDAEEKGEEESLKVGFGGPHKLREGGIPAGQRIRYCCQLQEKPRSAVCQTNVEDREKRE